MVEYYDARVLFDHLPLESDELHLRKGETVEVRVDHSADREQGWLYGADVRGQHGMFPENYVQKLAGNTLRDATESKNTALETIGNSSGTTHLITPGGDRVVRTPTNGGEQNGAGGRSPYSVPNVCHSWGNPHENTPGDAGDEESSSALRNAAALVCPADSMYHLVKNDPAAFDDNERDHPHEWSPVVNKSTGFVHDLREDGRASCSKPISVEEGRAAQGPFLARASPRKRKGETSTIGLETLNKVENTAEQRRTNQDEDDDDDDEEEEAVGGGEEKEQEAIRVQAARRGRSVRQRVVADHQTRQTRSTRAASNPRRYVGATSPATTASFTRGARGDDPNGGRDMIETTDSDGAEEGDGTAVTVDGPMAEFIALLIDERIMEELRHRDALLTSIQRTVAGLTKRQAVSSRCTSPDMEPREVYPAQSPLATLSPTPRAARTRDVDPLTAEAPPGRSSRNFNGQGMVMQSVPAVLSSPTRQRKDPRGQAPSALFPLSCSRAPPETKHEASRSLALGGGSYGATGAIAQTVRAPAAATPPVGPLLLDPLEDPCTAGQDGFGDGLGTNGYRIAGQRGSCDAPLPRVADAKEVRRRALQRQQPKAAKTKAVMKPSPRGRTTLYHPSWYDASRADASAPESVLQLEHIHGYSGQTTTLGNGGVPGHGVSRGAASVRGTNVFWLHTGEAVFPASSVVVVHDCKSNRQRFFAGHDEEVTALAVHPEKDIVASGQAGAEAIVFLLDASRGGRQRSPHRGMGSPLNTGLAEETDAPGTVTRAANAPVLLRELSIGRREKKGVSALDFSANGELLLAMSGGDGQTFTIWNWQQGTRLATARAESSFLRAHTIRFNPYLYLVDRGAKTAGLSPGEVCHTLVSCGERHVRFWTLNRVWYPGDVLSRGGGGRDNATRGSGWTWSLQSKPGKFGRRGVMDDMTCMTFIGQPRARGAVNSRRAETMDRRVRRLPVARTVTGTGSGHIYFWQAIEDDPFFATDGAAGAQTDGAERGATFEVGGLGWKPHGRLLAVVPRAHNGMLTDMCFLPREEQQDQRAATSAAAAGGVCAGLGHHGSPSSSPSRPSRFPTGQRAGAPRREWGRLATCGEDGRLRLWSVATGDGSSPLEPLATLEVSTRATGIGFARSVSWDRSGAALVLGTVGNAVCLVQAKEGLRPDSRRGEDDRVMFTIAVQGHMGACRSLAPHPSRPWFVTGGGTDKTLRLWDSRTRRQLSSMQLLENICSVAFHPSGHSLAVGSQTGDFLLISLRTIPVATSGERSDRGWGTRKRGNQSSKFHWEVLERKRVVVGGNVAGSPHRSLRSEIVADGCSGVYANGRYKRQGLNKRNGNPWGTGRGGSTAIGGGNAVVGDRQEHREGFQARGPVGLRRPRDEFAPASSSPSTKDRSPTRRPWAGVGEPDAPVGCSAAPAAPQAPGITRPCASALLSPSTEVSVVGFSPAGDVLAAACGTTVYLYLEAATTTSGQMINRPARIGGAENGSYGGAIREQGAYRRYRSCRGHSRTVRSFDFSRDGAILQSNDTSGELLFWEVSTGKQIPNGYNVRDVAMASWSCPVGWPTQGLTRARGGVGRTGFSPGASVGGGERGGILAVCRSNAGDLLAAWDEDNGLRLARNPAPHGATSRAYWGHSAARYGTPALAFLCHDQRLVSAGGMSAFVWRWVRQLVGNIRLLRLDAASSGGVSPWERIA